MKYCGGSVPSLETATVKYEDKQNLHSYGETPMLGSSLRYRFLRRGPGDRDISQVLGEALWDMRTKLGHFHSRPRREIERTLIRRRNAG